MGRRKINKDVAFARNIESGCTCKPYVLFCFLQARETIISNNNAGKNVAGIIVEPIQSEGGKNFAKRCICDHQERWLKVAVKDITL